MSATREDAIDEIIGAKESLADAVAALNRLMDRHQGYWSVQANLERERQRHQDRANDYAIKLGRCRDLAKQGLDLTGEEYPPYPLEELGRLLKEIIKCHD